ncbi:MAG: TetR family transcriptional regulator [Proteobacteria bacterium]|nr:TetR family transcriptional regulator [Pseudomonadota bacterium]
MDKLSPGKLKILQAVSTLLEEESVKITTAKIAQKVGVSEAAIYKHYSSKSDIFNALIAYIEAHLLTPLNQAQQESKNTRNRLQYIYKTYMEFLEGHPGLAKIILNQTSAETASIYDSVQKLNIKIRSQLNQICKFGLANKELANNFTSEEVTEAFYSIIVSFALTQSLSVHAMDRTDRWILFNKIFFPEQLL